MKMLDLFSGIGGFSLAAKWMGWETIAFCEIDKFCQDYIKINFPNIPIHGDIKTTDFTVYRGLVNILTGGDPCQPSSVAGKRQGKADARYLWPEMFRAIVQSQAGIVVNENVTGTISNGLLDQKISDLESAGYTCWPPFVIPASAVGAFHRRDRVWLIGYSNKLNGNNGGFCVGEISQLKETEVQRFVATNSQIGNDRGSIGEQENGQIQQSGNGIEQGVAPNAESEQFNRNINSRRRGNRFTDSDSDVANPKRSGRENSIHGGEPEWQAGESLHSSSEHNWWKENWYEAATRLCTLDDGLPGGLVRPKGWRVNALKACGNSIVPQVVLELYKAIDQYNKQNL